MSDNHVNRTERILVVEDDDALRSCFALFLEDCGYEVMGAADGAEGLAMVREHLIDLVLCDLRMPTLDGIEMIRILRSERPGLPVIVVSGTGVLGDAIEALREGAVDFLTKPIVDLEVLAHTVRQALEKARLERENRDYQLRLENMNAELRAHLVRFEQDAAAGRETQLQMMPPAKRVFGDYVFARQLQPSVNLSGDFVDYFVIDADHLGFYVADVSGHGIASGFVTALAKSMVDHYLEQLQQDGDATLLSPAQMLARLNGDLYRLQLDKYLTIFYGVIDKTRNTLTHSCGGHYPHPVLYDGERCVFVEGRGYPVGLFAQTGYEARTLTLPERFMLAVFSDGVLELLAGQPLETKHQRLLTSIAGMDSSVTDLLATLGLQEGQAYPDDITLLTVKRAAQ